MVRMVKDMKTKERNVIPLTLQISVSSPCQRLLDSVRVDRGDGLLVRLESMFLTALEKEANRRRRARAGGDHCCEHMHQDQ